MIIIRTGTKDKYEFKDLKNQQITDKAVLEYIKNLVIPPNYNDVKIFYEKTSIPKILYQGYDSKGRLQRIYSEVWNKASSRKKLCQLLNFAEQIPHISRSVKEQMKDEHQSRNKMIALIIRLVMVCYFRIGNKKYQELYGSFGAMNIQKRHVKLKKNSENRDYFYVEFSGKKGVLNTCNVYDVELVREIKKILKIRKDNDFVFLWNRKGILVPVRAIDINIWLQKFDKVITSKDFRTYDANIFLIIFLRMQRLPSKMLQLDRKKMIVRAMKEISGKIHNTPAILKKNYTDSGIIDMYISDPYKFEKFFIVDQETKSPKQSFIEYLRNYCKDFNN
jgi:DNA topoisomerase-1